MPTGIRQSPRGDNKALARLAQAVAESLD
ncbi:hypothetical protein NSPZN2_40408 [Nitrospira defluvii]|uniref:Uncharacterized protein n=1 Tax=Nitrospira defluvii TaxID=330214 RepID=A0ABM8RV44_9BACT|nr:hypothetical protein NSPZN2_40408 [Nitrospira defluvii]